VEQKKRTVKGFGIKDWSWNRIETTRQRSIRLRRKIERRKKNGTCLITREEKDNEKVY
jgi:hypothetical protein